MKHILNYTNVMELDLCIRNKYCLNLISVDFQFQYKLQMKIKKIILYKLIIGDFKSVLIQIYDITKESDSQNTYILQELKLLTLFI